MIHLKEVATLLFALPSISFAAKPNSLERSPLAEDITKFVIAHPEASLQKTVEYANLRLQDVGMNFDFDARIDAKDDSVQIDAEGRATSASVEEEGECGERFVPIAAVRITKSTIELPRNGKVVVARRPASLKLDSMQVMSPDLQNVIADVEVPSQAFPRGVTTAGAILLDFPLGGGAQEWWSRLQAKSKYFQGDAPYLIYEMVGGAPRFMDDERLYVNDSEPVSNASTDPKNAYVRYLKFKSTHLVVRFSAPCT